MSVIRNNMLSNFRYYREVIQGVNDTNTQHIHIQMHIDEAGIIDMSQAEISANRSVIEGSVPLTNLLNYNNQDPVTFGKNDRVEILIDLKRMYSTSYINLKHLTSGYLNLNIVQLSQDAINWYTVYDTRESGIFMENQNTQLNVNTSYWYNTDSESGIVLDTQDDMFFNPKFLIWDNDKKLQDYVTKLLSKSQYYDMDANSSTNTYIKLINPDGIYPTSYLNNMLINWIQLGSVSGISNIEIEIGGLGRVTAKFPGSSGTMSLDGGSPYIGIYDARNNQFLIVSGGGSGQSAEIMVYQPGHSFRTYDLAHYNPNTKQFEVANLLALDPNLVDAILEVQGDWLKGTLSGLVNIPGMTDTLGNLVIVGECYVCDSENPTKVTKDYPAEGFVQPIMQTYEHNGQLVALLMDTFTFTAGSEFNENYVGKGLLINNNVLEVMTPSDGINKYNPSDNAIPTEKQVVEYVKGLVTVQYDTKTEFMNDTKVEVGKVAECIGDTAIDDGLGAKYLIVNTEVEGSFAIQNGLFAVMIKNSKGADKFDKGVYTGTSNYALVNDSAKMFTSIENNVGGEIAGTIQSTPTKEQGKYYYDENNRGIYYCINTNTDIDNTTTNFRRDDNLTLRNELERINEFNVLYQIPSSLLNDSDFAGLSAQQSAERIRQIFVDYTSRIQNEYPDYDITNRWNFALKRYLTPITYPNITNNFALNPIVLGDGYVLEVRWSGHFQLSVEVNANKGYAIAFYNNNTQDWNAFKKVY